MHDQNLILAGFMGVGKSTVGQLCAQRLGFEFVDTDAVIAAREGMSIAEIFARHGEAHFRACERALVAELQARRRCVIATGGGMVVDDDNRHALLASGIGVCLTATPEAILKRVGGEHAARTRPLLRADDVRARIAELLRARAPMYADFPYHIDTTGHSPGAVADLACAIYQGERARVHVNIPEANARYDIVLGEGLLDYAGYLLAGRGWQPPFAIVSDDQVGPRYAPRLQAALAQAGLDSFIHLMPAGEAHKTLGSVVEMYRAFGAHGLERQGAVLALGGGVVGDTAGFAAATYLRGVPLVQIPTSLLAMADSSIGGKVGVDTEFGKNLVGAFKQPDLVIADLSALATLPEREWRCGMAEVIKAALLQGGAPYARLQATARAGYLARYAGDLERVTEILTDAIALKRAIVQADPFERDRRALLNLGHTFGHGIEAWSGFRLKHGEAVALGLVCALRLSRDLGVCSEQTARESNALLRDAGLPTRWAEVQALLSGATLDAEAIWQYMLSDKKRHGKRLRFVLLRAPGDAFVSDEVTPEQALRALSALESDE